MNINKLWKPEELNIIKNNYKLSKEELHKLLSNRTVSGIQHKASRLQYNKNYNWDDKINLLKKFYPTENKENLISMFNMPWILIKGAAVRYKIKRSKYINYNLSILETETPETYYWIGFLLADGCFCITRKNSYALSLELAGKDLEHLIKFKDFILYKNCISKRKRNDNCGLSCHDNKHIPNIMKKFNINPNKTKYPPDLSRVLSNTNNDLIFSLIVGLIDGDGMIRKVYKNSNQITIEQDRSWYKNLQFIEKFIYDYCKVPLENAKTHYKNTNSMDRNETAILSFCIKDLILKLKKNANVLKLPILYRKWDIIVP